MSDLIKRLNEYIEYATNVKRFADVGFYEEVKEKLNDKALEQHLYDVIDCKQAKIDSLMLEYCPNEMTEEQIKEWERHQKIYEYELALIKQDLRDK